MKLILLFWLLPLMTHANELRSQECSIHLQSEPNIIYLSAPDAEISAVESRPALLKILSNLNKYVHMANADFSFVARIYQPLVPKLLETIEEIKKTLAKDSPSQDEVYRLVYAFSQTVDFAARYTGVLARNCDLGLDGLRSFNNREYCEMIYRFSLSFKGTPFDRVLPATAQMAAEKWWLPQQGLSDTNYLIDGAYAEEPDKQHYFFQYKYAAAIGLFSLQDLFRDRERGVAYYSASVHSQNEIDLGRSYSSTSMLKHDLFHAFVMKWKDLKLFRRLGVTTLEGARSVKELNNRLLQKRIAELNEIREDQQALHAALEGLFFGLLHEQGYSYPLDVIDQLNLEAQLGFYKRGICNYADRGEFGERVKQLLSLKCPDLVDQGIAWLKPRAQEDAEEFHKSFDLRPAADR